MMKLQGVLSGVLMVSLAFAPALAHAQYVPENNPQACADGVDNDGNGYVDCYDPSCRMLPQCQPQQPPPPPPPYQQAPPPGYQPPPPPGYQPPPPGYPPPPPQYYQQAPQYQPLYVPPPPRPRPPQNGLGEIIVGSIFLPIGI